MHKYKIKWIWVEGNKDQTKEWMDRAHTIHKFFSGWKWNPVRVATASFFSVPRNPIWPLTPVPPSTSSITCPLPPLTSSPPAHSRSPIHHVSLHITLFSLITHTTIQPCISVKYRNGSLVQQYMHTFFPKWLLCLLLLSSTHSPYSRIDCGFKFLLPLTISITILL